MSAQRRQQLIVFALTLLVTTIVVCADHEALRWRRGVDLGFSLRGQPPVVSAVVAGGAAARAGIVVGKRVCAVEAGGVLRYFGASRLRFDSTNGVFLDLRGDVPLRMSLDDVRDDDGFDAPCPAPVEHVLQTDEPVRWFRRDSTFNLLKAWPFALLLSLVAAVIAGAVHRHAARGADGVPGAAP